MSEREPTREQDFVYYDHPAIKGEGKLQVKLAQAMALLKEVDESLGYLT